MPSRAVVKSRLPAEPQERPGIQGSCKEPEEPQERPGIQRCSKETAAAGAPGHLEMLRGDTLGGILDADYGA